MAQIQIYNLETNRSFFDFMSAEVYNCTFNSTALDALIPFLASEFNVNNFIYKNFLITNSGSGKQSWIDNQIQTGMLYNQRYGIGYFYFLLINNSDVVEPVQEVSFEESISDPVSFWDYLTTFFDYLK
jgi:hypothetical protein